MDSDKSFHSESEFYSPNEVENHNDKENYLKKPTKHSVYNGECAKAYSITTNEKHSEEKVKNKNPIPSTCGTTRRRSTVGRLSADAWAAI